MNFGKRGREEKFYCLENDIQNSVCLQPIKAVAEQPMYHNCASLCSLCEGEEGAKTIYISLVFMKYRESNQHADNYVFGSIHQVSVGFWQLNNFDWTKVGISVFTRFQ